MKLKKRNKRSRARGNRTLGYAMKKHKGSGNRGGKGMAGTGKRGDQRKSWVIKNQFPYFGKQGTTSKSTKKRRNKVINLWQIAEKYKAGELKLLDCTILGDGEITGKYIITAKGASKSAREKIKDAGGESFIVGEKEEADKKPEKKVVKKKE